MKNCPFEKKKPYRIRKTFTSLRDSFSEGETLTFDYDSWSHYDGITGYFFKDANNNDRVWDIYDEEDIEIWEEYFEPL